MTTREHVYRTNYRLLAGAWLAVFIVLAFSFHSCRLKGRKELPVTAAVRLLLSDNYPEPEDVKHSLIRGSLINAFFATLVAWPLQAILVAASAFVRRSPDISN
jgi:hypothetical protein